MQNGDVLIKNVFVPEEDILPGVNSFTETSEALAISGVMVAWQGIGIATGVYDMCHRYLKERRQFRQPLVAYQSVQQKLAQMLGDIQETTLVGWRNCKLYEMGNMTTGQASLAKAWITKKAIETVALGSIH